MSVGGVVKPGVLGVDAIMLPAPPIVLARLSGVVNRFVSLARLASLCVASPLLDRVIFAGDVGGDGFGGFCGVGRFPFRFSGDGEDDSSGIFVGVCSPSLLELVFAFFPTTVLMGPLWDRVNADGDDGALGMVVGPPLGGDCDLSFVSFGVFGGAFFLEGANVFPSLLSLAFTFLSLDVPMALDDPGDDGTVGTAIVPPLRGDRRVPLVSSGVFKEVFFWEGDDISPSLLPLAFVFVSLGVPIPFVTRVGEVVAIVFCVRGGGGLRCFPRLGEGDGC